MKGSYWGFLALRGLGSLQGRRGASGLVPVLQISAEGFIPPASFCSLTHFCLLAQRDVQSMFFGLLGNYMLHAKVPGESRAADCAAPEGAASPR